MTETNLNNSDMKYLITDNMLGDEKYTICDTVDEVVDISNFWVDRLNEEMDEDSKPHTYAKTLEQAIYIFEMVNIDFNKVLILNN